MTPARKADHGQREQFRDLAGDHVVQQSWQKHPGADGQASPKGQQDGQNPPAAARALGAGPKQWHQQKHQHRGDVLKDEDSQGRSSVWSLQLCVVLQRLEHQRCGAERKRPSEKQRLFHREFQQP
jgi:hypothetical protein